MPPRHVTTRHPNCSHRTVVKGPMKNITPKASEPTHARNNSKKIIIIIIKYSCLQLHVKKYRIPARIQYYSETPHLGQPVITGTLLLLSQSILCQFQPFSHVKNLLNKPTPLLTELTGFYCKRIVHLHFGKYGAMMFLLCIIGYRKCNDGNGRKTRTARDNFKSLSRRTSKPKRALSEH